jgi:glycine/serine hydroxymethyltransferase
MIIAGLRHIRVTWILNVLVIADSVGAILLADISHPSGLIAKDC